GRRDHARGDECAKQFPIRAGTGHDGRTARGMCMTTTNPPKVRHAPQQVGYPCPQSLTLQACATGDVVRSDPPIMHLLGLRASPYIPDKGYAASLYTRRPDRRERVSGHTAAAAPDRACAMPALPG